MRFPLRPLFVSVFALLLLTFRDDGSLPEQSHGWPDALIKVPLVHEGPVGISRLLANLDALQNLLLVDFERGEIIWGKHIRGTVETRQFHELAHDFRRFQTRTQRHLDVLPMFTHPLRIKGIRASHWQEFRPLNQLWLAIAELDNAKLHRLFPGFAHGFIQDFRVDQGHFWARVRHPLLNENQAHSVVDEFNSFRVAKSMEAEMKEIALLIADTMFHRQAIEAVSNATSRERIANQEDDASADVPSTNRNERVSMTTSVHFVLNRD